MHTLEIIFIIELILNITEIVQGNILKKELEKLKENEREY